MHEFFVSRRAFICDDPWPRWSLRESLPIIPDLARWTWNLKENK